MIFYKFTKKYQTLHFNTLPNKYLYLKISRNMQNTYYLPRASSNRPPFIIFPSINPFSVFMIHCDLVIPGIKGAFKDQKAHSFTRPILVSRRTYSRVIVDAATTLILKIRPHFRKILRVYKHLTSSKQQPLKSRRPLT